MPASTSFSDAYEVLSPVARLVALVYGVVYPYSATTARVTATLASAGFDSGGRRTACPMLAALDSGQRSLTLPEPADCLELLEQVHAVSARCLWPGGEPFKIVARAETAALKLSVRSAADWFRASGQLTIDEDRVLDLRQLFALLDKRPGSRFLELDDGEFVALTTAFHRQLDDLRSLSVPSAEGSIRLHPMTALALQDFVEQTRFDAAADARTRLRRLVAPFVLRRSAWTKPGSPTSTWTAAPLPGRGLNASPRFRRGRGTYS